MAMFTDKDFANLIMRAASTRNGQPGYRDEQALRYRDEQALEEAVSRAIEAGRLVEGVVKVQRADIE